MDVMDTTVMPNMQLVHPRIEVSIIQARAGIEFTKTTTIIVNVIGVIVAMVALA